MPVGHQRNPLKFLIDTGAQISLITLADAAKLNLKFKRKKVYLTGFNGNSTTAYIAKVRLWLPGEKRITSHMFAIADHEENILGYDILQGKTWQLPDGTVWSFGTAETSRSNLFGKNRRVKLLKMAPILPVSTVTNVKQYPIPLAAKQGITEVIKNLEQRDIIFRTHSAYNSPVWPVKKPDGNWRLTVDYRRLNTNTDLLTTSIYPQMEI